MLIKTDLINVSDSHRQVNEKTVEMLAVSMDMVGLLQPITVSNSKLLRGTYVDGYLLVAGNHRLMLPGHWDGMRSKRRSSMTRSEVFVWS